jgi:hypothetical protein
MSLAACGGDAVYLIKSYLLNANILPTTLWPKLNYLHGTYFLHPFHSVSRHSDHFKSKQPYRDLENIAPILENR